LYGYNSERALKKVEGIYGNIERVLEISKRDRIPTYLAADRLAEERIERMRQSRSQFLQNGHHILSRR
ncbi:leucine dehydrogenase, partial [Bacillus licheniformis]